MRSATGLSYVVYDRTYDGLPVIGGDLVIATDSAGTVKTTSVAQQQALGDLDVHGAKLSAAQAETVAASRSAGRRACPAGSSSSSPTAVAGSPTRATSKAPTTTASRAA